MKCRFESGSGECPAPDLRYHDAAMEHDASPLIPPPEFLDHLRSIRIDLDSGDIERFGEFLSLLFETNRQFNLTAIVSPEEAWIRHIADSLTLIPFLDSSDAQAVIDVGSGGGLPGLPLAIAMPQVAFTLLEATGKKAALLEAATKRLSLENVRVINERAETIGRDRAHHREHYDVAIARAVGRLAVLLELTVPLVKVGGQIFAIKGEKAPQELEEAKQALHMLHCRHVETVRHETGNVIVIEKLRQIPRIYTRRPGEPKHAPLGVTKNYRDTE